MSNATTVLLILLVTASTIAVVFAVQWVKAKKKLKDSELDARKFKTDLSYLKEIHEHLKQKAEPLWKYQHIADAQAEADTIISQAKENAAALEQKSEIQLDSAKQKAEAILKGAFSDAQNLKTQASEKLNDAKIKVEEILQQARTNADKTIRHAQEQAELIAGEALAAKGKADLFEKKAQALKNIIQGYGDEYLVAAKTLLDELAEDFSHKEGGVELKKARLYTKTLVTSGRAATCDYVEESRRTTATRFVLDAFNGKVDSALSKVKHDNFGKLEQEIKDAFGLVNGHGQAFRDARITEEYLSARLDELKWAVVTQELKLQEREEQRRIQEAIREEEKARRDYEKAIREAEKEEQMLQQAMEKVRKQLEGANEEQRQQYEQQIADLQAKYEEAEARNQRAISMAQQTRRGHVYVISNEGSFGDNVYKIGLTRRLEPLDRVKELGDASVPFEFDVHAMIYSEDAPTLENELHRHFDETRLNKINTRKEFFKATLHEIREIIEARGIEAHWTMAAEAREYRESLAIEMARNHEKQREEIHEFDTISMLANTTD